MINIRVEKKKFFFLNLCIYLKEILKNIIIFRFWIFFLKKEKKDNDFFFQYSLPEIQEDGL